MATDIIVAWSAASAPAGKWHPVVVYARSSLRCYTVTALKKSVCKPKVEGERGSSCSTQPADLTVGSTVFGVASLVHAPDTERLLIRAHSMTALSHAHYWCWIWVGVVFLAAK